jgi:hypothetical protein
VHVPLGEGLTVRVRADADAGVEVGELPLSLDAQDVVRRDVEVDEPRGAQHLERLPHIARDGLRYRRRIFVGVREELVQRAFRPLPDREQVAEMAVVSAVRLDLVDVEEPANRRCRLDLRPCRQRDRMSKPVELILPVAAGLTDVDARVGTVVGRRPVSVAWRVELVERRVVAPHTAAAVATDVR